MKRRKPVFCFYILLFVLMLILVLSACDDDTPVPESNPTMQTDEEALVGQWNIYRKNPKDPSDLQLTARIDIQHTLPGYWIIMGLSDPMTGDPFKSDRTGPAEDGWFVVTWNPDKIRYRFVDDERNTLEAEVKEGDVTWMICILERIPSEEEIDMHIVSFKLDDSIASGGYVLSDESVAIEAGKAFGEEYELPKLVGPDGMTVVAEYKMEDDSVFTRETPVTADITVIVTPLV